jgi:hypothetical protein
MRWGVNTGRRHPPIGPLGRPAATLSGAALGSPATFPGNAHPRRDSVSGSRTSPLTRQPTEPGPRDASSAPPKPSRPAAITSASIQEHQNPSRVAILQIEQAVDRLLGTR